MTGVVCGSGSKTGGVRTGGLSSVLIYYSHL
jgi:hypothetical protein